MPSSRGPMDLVLPGFRFRKPAGNKTEGGSMSVEAPANLLTSAEPRKAEWHHIIMVFDLLHHFSPGTCYLCWPVVIVARTLARSSSLERLGDNTDPEAQRQHNHWFTLMSDGESITVSFLPKSTGRVPGRCHFGICCPMSLVAS